MKLVSAAGCCAKSAQQRFSLYGFTAYTFTLAA
jgi:hypothetical protein